MLKFKTQIGIESDESGTVISRSARDCGLGALAGRHSGFCCGCACDSAGCNRRDGGEIRARLLTQFRLFRQLHHPLGILYRLACVFFGVLLGWDEIYVAIEGQFPFLAQAFRNNRCPLEVFGNRCLKSVAVFQEKAANVVVFRRLHADSPKHALQGEFDGLLRLTNNIGIILPFPQSF